MISIEENQQVYKEQVTWDKLEKRLTEMEDTFTNRINSLNQNILQLKQQLENRNASLPPYRGTQQVSNYNSYNSNKQISLSQKQKTFIVVMGLLILLVLGFVYYIIYFKPESAYDCRYFKPENLDYDESSWKWGSQLFTAFDYLFTSEKEHRKMYMERVYSIQKIHPQMLVNTATPFSNSFHIASNNLTLRYEVEEGLMQQILLIPSIKGPTFRVHVYIDTLLTNSEMGLGVVDQWTSS